MSFPFALPVNMHVVTALVPQAGGALTGAYISCKSAHKVWVVVSVAQANAAICTISVNQATSILGAGSVPVTVVLPIWSDLDCALGDELVSRAAAVNYALDAALKQKLVILEVSPETLSLANATCICVKMSASDPTNIYAAWYLIAPRYQPPISAVVD